MDQGRFTNARSEMHTLGFQIPAVSSLDHYARLKRICV